MKLEDIPRREEVLILIEALKRLDRVIITALRPPHRLVASPVGMSRARCGSAPCAARR